VGGGFGVIALVVCVIVSALHRDPWAVVGSAIYGSALFFCEIFRKSIAASADYLTSTIPMEKRAEAKSLLLNSCNLLDGTTTPAGSLSTSE